MSSFWVPPPTTVSIDGPKPWRPVVFTCKLGRTRPNGILKNTNLPSCHFVDVFLPAGGGTAPVVVHVFENTHFWPGCGGGVNVHVKLRHMRATSHHWVGGGVNVHVNLRHIHMLRHVTGLGGVNVHVNLRHIHMLRQVTGLVGCYRSCKLASHLHATSGRWIGEGANVHVNLRHIHMLRQVTRLGGC